MSDVSLAPYAPPPSEVFDKVTPFTQYDAPLRTQYDSAASSALGYDVWRITESFKFYIGNIKDDVWVYIPAGYLSDGATVPRLFWDLIPPWGSYGQAAVVHDMLCEYLTVFKSGVAVPIDRKHADNLLKDAMTALSVPPITKWLIYAGVKVYDYFTDKTKPDAFAQKRQLEDSWGVTANPPAAEPTTGTPA